MVEVGPTAFMEGLLLQTAKTVSMQDKIMAPFGRGKNSAIAAADVARVIAEILSEPAEHIGQTYHLTGPVSQDMDAVARELRSFNHRDPAGPLVQRFSRRCGKLSLQ
jgi:uncharacterized protein YbjT (DUF2867 family)